MVTCAGILRDRMVFNMTEEEWDDVIAVHLKGTFTVVKHACILFRQQRSGRIITFSSQSGLVGNSGQANYGAAKSGIAGFTKVVARDMGRYGVTCNSIAPRAQTRMIGAIPDSAAEIRARSGVASLSEGNELEQLDPDHIAPFHMLLGQRLYGHGQRPDIPGLRRLSVADVPAQTPADHLRTRRALGPGQSISLGQKTFSPRGSSILRRRHSHQKIRLNRIELSPLGFVSGA